MSTFITQTSHQSHPESQSRFYSLVSYVIQMTNVRKMEPQGEIDFLLQHNYGLKVEFEKPRTQVSLRNAYTCTDSVTELGLVQARRAKGLPVYLF